LILEISYSKTSSPRNVGLDLQDKRILSLAYYSMELMVNNCLYRPDLDSRAETSLFGFHELEDWGCWSKGSKSCLIIKNCFPGDSYIRVIIDAHAFRDAFSSCVVTFRTSSGHQGKIKIGKRRLYEVLLKLPRFSINKRLAIGDFSYQKHHNNVSNSCKKPVISIIIINYNKSYLTQLSYAAIISSHIRVPFEIICIDNGSNDNDFSQLKLIKEPLTLIRNNTNTGFSIACNKGVKLSRGEFILFLNNDAFLQVGTIDEMTKAFEVNSDCRIVGSVMRFPDGTMQEAGATLKEDAHPIRHGRYDLKYNVNNLPRFKCVDYVSGACLMIRKSDFIEMQGFDEKYSPAYYEDTDLCMRSLLYGQKVYLASRATCLHIENVTSTSFELGVWATQTAEAHRWEFLKDWSAYLASRNSKDLPWHLKHET
jgi:GT2 family glycosyltransferase